MSAESDRSAAETAGPSVGTRRSILHPVRMAHLGLGAFHRAHQAWYTQRANDAGDDWGIAAFTGRSADAAIALTAQDDVYTLIERAQAGDTASVIESISAAHDGADASAWRRVLADPELALVTVTITEAGYRTRGGSLDTSDAGVVADIQSLANGGAASTAPGRLVDGLLARRRAGGGPIALVSCDNLTGNGDVLRTSVLALAGRVDRDLGQWIEKTVSFVSTMVDRITPATTDDDRRTALRLTGLSDTVPVVTEPFSEWILSGNFPAGRPRWEAAGARIVDDIAPFEQRKLWLLNAGHSLLAYRGLLHGHSTVFDAFSDPQEREALESLWAEARPVIPFDDAEIDDALESLRIRFANPRIEHRLRQIATDGSHKLTMRIVDVMTRRTESGLPAGHAQLGVIGAWAVHVSGPDRSDPGADELAASMTGRSANERARIVVGFLAPDFATPAVIAGVAHAITTLESSTR